MGIDDGAAADNEGREHMPPTRGRRRHGQGCRVRDARRHRGGDYGNVSHTHQGNLSGDHLPLDGVSTEA